MMVLAALFLLAWIATIVAWVTSANLHSRQQRLRLQSPVRVVPTVAVRARVDFLTDDRRLVRLGQVLQPDDPAVLAHPEHFTEPQDHP